MTSFHDCNGMPADNDWILINSSLWSFLNGNLLALLILKAIYFFCSVSQHSTNSTSAKSYRVQTKWCNVLSIVKNRRSFPWASTKLNSRSDFTGASGRVRLFEQRTIMAAFGSMDFSGSEINLMLADEGSWLIRFSCDCFDSVIRHSSFVVLSWVEWLGSAVNDSPLLYIL